MRYFFNKFNGAAYPKSQERVEGFPVEPDSDENIFENGLYLKYNTTIYSVNFPDIDMLYNFKVTHGDEEYFAESYKAAKNTFRKLSRLNEDKYTRLYTVIGNDNGQYELVQVAHPKIKAALRESVGDCE